MSAQTKWQFVGMLRRGVVAGALAVAGANVAVDNPGWVGYSVAGVAAILAAAKVSRASFRAAGLERRGRDARIKSTDMGMAKFVRLPDGMAHPVSIETTRDVLVSGENVTLSARVGVLVAEERLNPGQAYLTYAQRDVLPTQLDSLERQYGTVRVHPKDAGTVLLSDPSGDDPLRGFAEVDDLPPELRLPGMARRRGRGRVAMAGFCTAALIAGTATGILLPDTSNLVNQASAKVSSIFTEVAGSTFGEENHGEQANKALADLLAKAEAVSQGSSTKVRDVDISQYSASLSAYDEQKGRDFTVNIDTDSVSWGAQPVNTRGTFNLSNGRAPNLDQMRTKAGPVIGGQVNSVMTIAGIEISRSDDTADPLVTLTFDDENHRSLPIQATMDGNLAPYFSPQDMSQAYFHLHYLLTSHNVSVDDKVLLRVTIQSSLTSAPWLSGIVLGAGISRGGVQAEVITDRGFGTLTLIPGQFATEEWEPNTYGSDVAQLEPFALTDFTADQLAKRITEVGAKSGAESADRQAVTLEIHPQGVDPDMPSMSINTSPDSSGPLKENYVRPRNILIEMQLGDLDASHDTSVLIPAADR